MCREGQADRKVPKVQREGKRVRGWVQTRKVKRTEAITIIKSPLCTHRGKLYTRDGTRSTGTSKEQARNGEWTKRERERGAKRKGESRRITDSGNRDFSPSGAERRVARRRNEDGGKIEGRERIGRKKIEERRVKRE